jgi:hypothetical protein
MLSVKNVPKIMDKTVKGTAPEKFTIAHLKGLGFARSTNRGIIPLLKDLGFLSSDGTPTQRYHEYRNPARSKQVMGEAIREAYEEIFHINANPGKEDRKAIHGKFKTTHNVTDKVADFQTMTFYALLDLADITGIPPKTETPEIKKEKDETIAEREIHRLKAPDVLRLRYNIEIHLPASKDVDVYNAIFKSLKEHLID